MGLCRMTLEQFEAMTPREMVWRYDAEVQRENREFQRLAQLACWVMNPWLGNQKMRVKDLLGNGQTEKSVNWWDEDDG